MSTQNQTRSTSGQMTGKSTGSHDTPLTDTTYNMVSALKNITDALWHYDEYIQQEQDDDAREMWQRFKQKDQQMADELKNHLSRRVQKETGPEGKLKPGSH